MAEAMPFRLDGMTEILGKCRSSAALCSVLLFSYAERLDLKTDNSLPESGVGKHPGDLCVIRLRDQNRTAEVALGLGSL